VLAVPAFIRSPSALTSELSQLGDEPMVDLRRMGIRIAVDAPSPPPASRAPSLYEVNDTATMGVHPPWTRHRMLPRSLVETTGDIVFVPIRDHRPEFKTAIAIPANRRLSAATRAMLETIKRPHQHLTRSTRQMRVPEAPSAFRGPEGLSVSTQLPLHETFCRQSRAAPAGALRVRRCG